MNTYLIPVTAPYQYEPYDYIYMVYANSPKEAYEKANKKLQENIPQKLDHYEVFHTQIKNVLLQPFHSSKKYDILRELLSHTQGAEYMSYFYLNWNNYTEQLSEMILTENWSNNAYPNRDILVNYLINTYKKLQAERKIVIGSNYALFNTGLFSKYYEPIYAYQTGSEVSFLTAYNLSGMGIKERPERADYFEHPELLLFDWHYEIDVHYQHILEDPENRKRIPKSILEQNNIINILSGAISKMKKQVSANYKLAIPQYFNNQIQLLLPLCLEHDNIPDLALVVTKTENSYRGHTCLTLDMAYNNARLIAKQDSGWLTTHTLSTD